MDSELKGRVSEVAVKLAQAERERLRAAGTLIELEELVCEIGDELARQMLGGELVERANESAEEPWQRCPTCDGPCQRATPRQRRLLSTRGEVSYHEPAFYCRYCRRSFFPGGRFDGIAGTGNADSETDSTDSLGRK